MELKGEHTIPASRETVWAALHDPEILKDCIKGCKSLEKVGEDALVATVEAKVGPVKATFDANVAIENSVAPERYTLVGEGKGGVAGFAKGSADVELADAQDGGTVLTYHAKANVGGKLAQLGSRLVDSTAKKYAADFFANLSEKLGGGEAQSTPEAAAPAAETVTAAAPVAPPSATSEARQETPFFARPIVWVVVTAGAVILIAALLFD